MSKLIIDMPDSMKKDFKDYCYKKDLSMRAIINTFVLDLVEADKRKKKK